MTGNRGERIRFTLEQLAGEGDSVVRAIAMALLSALPGAERAGPGDPALAEVRERISAVVERLAADGSGPMPIVEALVAIDRALSADGLIDGPWMAGLAPLAAELWARASEERREAEEAMRSPVFRVDASTLVAVPVGRLDRDGLQTFTDRVLAAADRLRPRRVFLALHGLDLPPGTVPPWEALAEDLAARRVSLEILGGESEAGS